MMIYTTLTRLLLSASLALILAACGVSQSGTRAVEEAAALEAAHRQAEEQAAAARAAEQQLAAERARVAALEAERERSAAAAAQAAQREAAQIAQRDAGREAELARVQSQARATEQTQVTQLERQIENTNNEVRELTAVNNSLEQAVAAAEELLRALNEEQLKYANTTPTGELLEPLDKDRIAELEARVEALKRQAESQSR